VGKIAVSGSEKTWDGSCFSTETLAGLAAAPRMFPGWWCSCTTRELRYWYPFLQLCEDHLSFGIKILTAGLWLRTLVFPMLMSQIEEDLTQQKRSL
jgi:hypothetical protein